MSKAPATLANWARTTFLTVCALADALLVLMFLLAGLAGLKGTLLVASAGVNFLVGIAEFAAAAGCAAHVAVLVPAAGGRSLAALLGALAMDAILLLWAIADLTISSAPNAATEAAVLSGFAIVNLAALALAWFTPEPKPSPK
jgi:hypothetical protein